MNIAIDDIFRIINFIVLASVVVYVIRRYGILYIIGMMREERNYKEQLLKEHKALCKDYEDIEHDIKEQESSYRSMKKKFATWADKVRVTTQKQQETLLAREKKIEQQHIVKVANVRKRRLMKQQLPELLQEVEKDLQQRFKVESGLQQKYNAVLLKILED